MRKDYDFSQATKNSYAAKLSELGVTGKVALNDQTMNATGNLSFKSITHTGLNPGPRIIITGAVHGNETCGTKAVQRVINDIDSGELQIANGQVTFVPITNPLAYARGERMGDRNLNRNLGPTDQPRDFEDHIANWLCPLFAQHDVLLDLHILKTNGRWRSG
jgi:predicted deacylase